MTRDEIRTANDLSALISKQPATLDISNPTTKTLIPREGLAL